MTLQHCSQTLNCLSWRRTSKSRSISFPSIDRIQRSIGKIRVHLAFRLFPLVVFPETTTSKIFQSFWTTLRDRTRSTSFLPWFPRHPTRSSHLFFCQTLFSVSQSCFDDRQFICRFRPTSLSSIIEYFHSDLQITSTDIVTTTIYSSPDKDELSLLSLSLSINSYRRIFLTNEDLFPHHLRPVAFLLDYTKQSLLVGHSSSWSAISDDLPCQVFIDSSRLLVDISDLHRTRLHDHLHQWTTVEKAPYRLSIDSPDLLHRFPNWCLRILLLKIFIKSIHWSRIDLCLWGSRRLIEHFGWHFISYLSFAIHFFPSWSISYRPLPSLW